MTWFVEKRSTPVWTKRFGTEPEAVAELRRHICADCLSGTQRAVGMLAEQIEKPSPESASDLLGTACGCEFDLYENAPTRRVVKIGRARRRG